MSNQRYECPRCGYHLELDEEQECYKDGKRPRVAINAAKRVLKNDTPENREAADNSVILLIMIMLLMLLYLVLEVLKKLMLP